jgi:8-oxo-dGTP pyrophosphatase MutT (NUDIX family)
MADYNKVGLLVVKDNKILLCRKKHTTSKLILPGGCIEEGETHWQCLARELKEELGEQVLCQNPQWLGSYDYGAASDDPTVTKTLHIELYQGELMGILTASSEIKELIWFANSDSFSALSPSLSQLIIPDLIHRKIINWIL